MWTRKELKDRAKMALNLNYWKTVLVGILLIFLVGGITGTAAFGSSAAGTSSALYGGYTFDPDSMVEESGEITFPEAAQEEAPAVMEGLMEDEVQQFGHAIAPMAFLAIAGVILVLILFLSAFIIAINALLLNPLEVGGMRFLVTNLHQPAEIKELAFGYDHCYKNSVKTLFLRDLYTVLWSLLFVIPGIIKAYEYRMMPYILADDPTLPTSEVFAQSKAMMKGNKWKAFVLDLSFIGWEILSLLTAGLLDTFYVRPYRLMTNAALYEALKYNGVNEESTVWTES